MRSLDRSAARRAGVILVVLAAVEGAFIVTYPRVWLSAAFARADGVVPPAWLACAAVTAGYALYSVRSLPSLAPLLTRISTFKVLAPIIAVPSGILEEVFFRSSLMDGLAAAHRSLAEQVVVSAFAFGVAHGAWGFRGGWRAVTGAVTSTSLLGFFLALLYLAAGRIVFPCVVAHFAINMLLEPWLMYAYVLRAKQRVSRAQ